MHRQGYMQRHGPAPPCGATALASPALCSCAGRRAARRSLPYLSPDCSALAVQWQLALTSAIAGCSACLCLPSASHSGTEQALSTQHAAHSCQAAKAAPAQVQRHACPLPDGLGRGQMRTAPGRASAPGSSRSSTRTASPRTHTSQQPRAADRRHAPGCAVSSACFRLVWQETPAGRLHRVAARWHSYAVCLSFADRRSCAASLGFHLQNLSVLDAQRRSKRSCAVLPVTGASYPAQDTHHQPVCTASLTHTRRVSTSCAPCRISCGARKEEPQGVFLTFPPCRIRTLWARPGALRGGDMHDAGGGGSSPPSPFQSRARIPAHTSCQSARTRRSR